MSDERRKRQQERDEQATPQSWPVRKIAMGLLIVAAFAAAYYLGLLKRHSRYDAFAQCITARGAKMYGAFWCPHCQEQEEAFDSAFQYVNYVECGVKGDTRAQSPACKQAEIKHYPTWEFASASASKERFEGKQTFEFMAQKTGCSLP